MTIKVVPFAARTAYLDPMTGQGLLVMPDPDDDLRVGGPSLHEAGWNQMVRELDRLGFAPADTADGCLPIIGTSAIGAELVALVSECPITTEPTEREWHIAFSAVLDAAYAK